MRYNILGKTALRLSEMGLGTWEMSGDVWGKKDDSKSIRAIHTALDAGINYIDTAAGYGSGHSEQVIGKALKERHEKGDNVVVSTKVLPKCMIWAPPPEKDIDEFFPPDWIVEQCEKSLRNLQIEQIGILFLHTWNSSWGHRIEWYETMHRLKEQGKIQAIGISIGDERVAEANVHIESERVDAIQCVYNVFQQEPEYNLFPLARKHRVGIIARSPFSSGALTGTWKKGMTFPEGDWRGRWPAGLGLKDWADEQVNMAEFVRPTLEGAGVPMSIAALKFVLMNPDITSVIPGSADHDHVKSNISAIFAPPLTEKAMKDLKQLWLDRKIHGTYNGSI